MNDIHDALAVVIPVYGDRGHLQEIIDALEAQRMPVQEVVISHSGDGDPTDRLCSERLPVRYLHRDERLNSGAARNRGAALTSARWIAFLDDDVIPDENWSQAVRDALSNDAGNTCFVGSLGVDVGGGYWGMSLWYLEFGSVHPYLPAREVEGGASANMFLHRELFDRCGGFPEQVNRSVDVEFMIRCREAGAHCLFLPTARVGHRNIGGFNHNRIHALTLGEGSARVRLKNDMRGSPAARYRPLAIFLPFARLLLMAGRIARWGTGHRISFILHLPGILVLATAWGKGFYRGSSGKAAARANG